MFASKRTLGQCGCEGRELFSRGAANCHWQSNPPLFELTHGRENVPFLVREIQTERNRETLQPLPDACAQSPREPPRCRGRQQRCNLSGTVYRVQPINVSKHTRDLRNNINIISRLPAKVAPTMSSKMRPNGGIFAACQDAAHNICQDATQSGSHGCPPRSRPQCLPRCGRMAVLPLRRPRLSRPGTECTTRCIRGHSG
jgi:hypothetical protein